MTDEPRTPRLYELAPHFRDLMERLSTADPSTDEGLAEIAALGNALEQTQMAMTHKVDGAAGIVREYELAALSLADEMDRLSRRRSALETRARNLKRYLLEQMRASRLTKIEGTRFTASIRKNTPALEVDSIANLPREFIRTKITEEPNKDAIKAHHKATGELPPGCRITRGERLDLT